MSKGAAIKQPMIMTSPTFLNLEVFRIDLRPLQKIFIEIIVEKNRTILDVSSNAAVVTSPEPDAVR